jgi:thiol-disulfide isomerase/thioredoxin
MAFKKYFFVLFILSFLFLQKNTLAQSANFSTESPQNLDEVIRKAKKENLVIVILFGADWCPPCLNLKNVYLNASNDNTNLKENTLFYYSDVETIEGKEFKDRFNVTEFPTMVVFSPKKYTYFKFKGGLALDKIISTVEDLRL